MMARHAAGVAAVAAALLLAGCEKAMQDMYDQPRDKPMAASKTFADGSSARPLVAGTMAHAQGAFAGTSSGRDGEQAVQDERAAREAQTNPYPITLALLQRGRQRYDIYCSMCHSVAGDGDGQVVRRGFPRPPTFHQDRLRQVPDRYLYDVISNGYGIMYPFADKVEPADRWAIAAYIRALQLSQHAAPDEIPPQLRERLPAQAARAASGSPQ